uniref:CCHC-type domain-containing protein n=1 Tax=Tanacetum cinerariifolium TaxID=118510 RepID=A0A6L2LJD3_TANCI|nr:hypothetical protein [Tanacetum cinerariifolium]
MMVNASNCSKVGKQNYKQDYFSLRYLRNKKTHMLYFPFLWNAVHSEMMENLMGAKQVWNLIDPGIREPAAIDRVTFEQIMDRKTSKAIWDSMKQRFAGNERVKRSMLQKLRRDFEVLEMKTNKTILDYFDKYMYVVVSIEESRNVEEMSIEELQSTLVVHEQKFNKVEREDDQALKIEAGFSPNGRGYGRGRGRGRLSFNKETIECYNCHKLGHYSYECPHSKEANYAGFDENEEVMLMAKINMEESSFMADATRENKGMLWFLDSGCSIHMCGNKDRFVDLDLGFTCSVKLGNNSRMMVVGKGNVKLFLNESTYVIKDVYHVPDLKNNLLSIGQLQQKGLSFLLQSDVCKVFHQEKGLIFQSFMSKNRMFPISEEIEAVIEQVADRYMYTSDEDNVRLWHERMGHHNNTSMETLQRKNMVLDLPRFPVNKDVCGDCMIGKQTKVAIPRAKKSQALKSFRQFKRKVETETRKTIKALRTNRSDNGVDEQNSNSDNSSPETPDSGPSSPVVGEGRPQRAMDLEIYAIVKNQTWRLVDLPNGTKCIGLKWLFKTKLNEKGEVDKYKARVVVRGYGQEFGVDYEEVYASVAQDVYVQQPQGYVVKNNEHKVYKLQKALYGLKQAPRAWFSRIEAYFDKEGFTRSSCEHALFIKTTSDGKLLFVNIYVDDLLYTGNDEGMLDEFKSSMKDEFEMTDMGKMRYFLGIEVFQSPVGIHVSQQKYAVEILTRFNMLDCNTVVNPIVPGCKLKLEEGEPIDETLYKSLVGSLMYITTMRPDIQFVEHLWDEAAVSWSSKKQNIVALSSTEAKYVVAAACACQVIWIRDNGADEQNSNSDNSSPETPDSGPSSPVVGEGRPQRTKLNEKAKVDKCKARVVVRGYGQEFGVDYEEVYTPVARMDTIRLMIALAAQKGWNIYQMDVKSAFLHETLEEDVYVQQPHGYVNSNSDNSSPETPDSGPSSPVVGEGRPQRVRRRPTHLNDYFVGDDQALDSEDDELHIVDLIHQDPIYYEDAVKDHKWRKAMNLEIHAIEKNQT